MPDLASVIDTVADVKLKALGNSLIKHAICLINFPRVNNFFYVFSLFFIYFILFKKLIMRTDSSFFFFLSRVQCALFSGISRIISSSIKIKLKKKNYPLEISHCSKINIFNQTLKRVKRYLPLDFLICFKEKGYLQRKTAIEKLDKVQVLIHSTSLWIFL